MQIHIRQTELYFGDNVIRLAGLYIISYPSYDVNFMLQ